ncbi:hypothetical protein [Parachlamydia sp. AcF125]|uniref:hypothetical protein n=1 Tax=Parachlamydia sp. AcF125 TaxID=2795736 RepID=UPI001BC9E936|nr:hypothetical protein [Parachlamydia sp. AcF125]MBS4168977.1 hypothetical protein [Parachlamydia sp. AcF125]
MKNKITYLILAFLANFSFTFSAYCQLMANDVYCPEPYIAAPAPDFDCDVRDAYRYAYLGVGPVIFIPNVGIGYRERYSQFGWDTGLSFSTIGYAHQLGAHLVGHYYLSPLRKNSVYFDIGLTVSGTLTNRKEGGGTLSSDFVFGKELEKNGDNSHFIEMHVPIPTP